MEEEKTIDQKNINSSADDTNNKVDAVEIKLEDKKTDINNDDKLEDTKLLAEVMDKKEKLRKAQAEKEKLEATLKQYGDIDPKRARELIEREKAAAQKEVEARGEYEQAKKMMAKDHQNQVQALNEEIAKLNTELDRRNQTIDGLTLGNSFANSSFIKDNLILTPTKARVLYGSYFEVKDGNIIPYNKPSGSPDRAPLVNANGDVYSFDAAFAKIIEADPDKDTLLRSKIKEGAASRTDNIGSKKQPADNSLFGVKRILAGLNSEKVA